MHDLRSTLPILEVSKDFHDYDYYEPGCTKRASDAAKGEDEDETAHSHQTCERVLP